MQGASRHSHHVVGLHASAAEGVTGSGPVQPTECAFRVALSSPRSFQPRAGSTHHTASLRQPLPLRRVLARLRSAAKTRQLAGVSQDFKCCGGPTGSTLHSVACSTCGAPAGTRKRGGTRSDTSAHPHISLQRATTRRFARKQTMGDACATRKRNKTGGSTIMYNKRELEGGQECRARAETGLCATGNTPN